MPACMAFSAAWGTSLVLPTRFIHIYISINTTDDLHMQFDIANYKYNSYSVQCSYIDVVHKKQNLPLHFVERAAKLLTFLYKSPHTTHTVVYTCLSCMHALMLGLCDKLMLFKLSQSSSVHGLLFVHADILLAHYITVITLI